MYTCVNYIDCILISTEIFLQIKEKHGSGIEMLILKFS